MVADSSQKTIDELRAALAAKDAEVKALRSHLARTQGLNVLIPMAGPTDDFISAGYRHPKPMVNILGRPLLIWILEQLSVLPEDVVWITLPQLVEEQFGVSHLLRRQFPHLDFRFVLLTVATTSWAETMVCCLRNMDDASLDRRAVCLDCHLVPYGVDLLAQVRTLSRTAGATFYFRFSEGDVSGGRKSYIRLNDMGEVISIREKSAISAFANAGAYVFPTALMLRSAVTRVIDHDSPCGSGDEKSSASNHGLPAGFASSVIWDLIKSQQVVFLGKELHRDGFEIVASPEEMKSFVLRISNKDSKLSQHPAFSARQTFCFDLERTLFGGRASLGGVWPSPRPVVHQPTVRLLKQLKSSGHTVVIHTRCAQGTQIDSGRGVQTLLEELGIPYDQIHFDKPTADVYIDNLAVSTIGDFKKDLGIDFETDGEKHIAGGVLARHFNEVSLIQNDYVLKSSSANLLAGEIYFYEHIPDNLIDVFPEICEITNGQIKGNSKSSILMKKIRGVTFSQLAANRCLTAKRLIKFLHVMHRIHTSNQADLQNQVQLTNSELATNYSPKIKKRFEQHRALYLFHDPDAEQLYNQIYNYVEQYSGCNDSHGSIQHAWVIHGDPVFSNVLFTNEHDIRLIDMRGSLGDFLSTQGDVNYDLSKIYQSLCGYDYLLLDKPMTDSAVVKMYEELRATFWQFVKSRYKNVNEDDVRFLAAAHFFSIVPLHSNARHQKAFLEKARQIVEEESKLDLPFDEDSSWEVAEIGAYIGKRGLVSRTPSHAGISPSNAAKREESEEQRQPLAELYLHSTVTIAVGQDYASIEGITGGAYLLTAHWPHENNQFKPRDYNRTVLVPPKDAISESPIMVFDIPQKGGPNDGPLQAFNLTLWRRQQGFHADELLGSSDNIDLERVQNVEWQFKRKADSTVIASVKVDLNIADRIKMNPRGQGRILTNPNPLGSPSNTGSTGAHALQS